MANSAQELDTVGGGEGPVGLGWRVFQLLALLAGVSYVIGWVVAGPASYLDGVIDAPGALSSYTSLISLLSPLVSVAVILLAVDPHRLNLLTRKGPAARVAAILLLVVTVGWLVNGLFTPMYTKFITTPFAPAQVLPIPGGVALHMVLQHWFQSFAVLALALMPYRFRALVDSPSPAGIQCAVVRC
jgi:uncharacterized membrane protein YhdT